MQKSLERGWRVVVQASSDERVEALDAHLWTWRDDAFLPHGTWRDAEAAEQPVLLTRQRGKSQRRRRALPGRGRRLPGDAAAYQRLVLLFDGDDPEALETARARWSKAKNDGLRGDLLAHRREWPLAAPSITAQRFRSAPESLISH